MNAAVPPAHALKWGRSAYRYPGRWLGTGNRCGHRPDKGEFERFTAPTTARPLPKIMQQLLDGVRTYYNSPAILPTLSNLNGRANADGRPRCNRSEARAAEVLVLQAIITHTEFASLRVGTPRPDGSFLNRSCGELAKIAGLEAPGCDPERPEPSQRFWRAFRRLKNAGAITVHQQYEVRPDGSKRARFAIKALNPDFLLALGKVGYQALKQFRDRCSNQLKKWRRRHREKFPAEYDAGQARRRLAMGQRGDDWKSALPKQRRGPHGGLPDVDAEREAQRQYNQQATAYMASVMANNPGASHREVLELVRTKYPPWRERQ